jgi:hypothetical protein
LLLSDCLAVRQEWLNIHLNALLKELISLLAVLCIGLWPPVIDRNFIYYFFRGSSEH